MSLQETVRQHLQALHIGSKVTRWFREKREPNVLEVTPENVIATLHRAGIRFVLMGTHGINVYRDQARATEDVDVLVVKRAVRRALRVLEEAFPYLEIIDSAAVARFVNPVTQKVVIDVMKPSSEAMKAVFRHTIPIGDTHRIPDLEMAIVSKFLAMKAPNRKRPRRSQDLADLMNMVETNRDGLDLQKLSRLGDRVRHHGGEELLTLVGDLDANRPIEI